MLYSMIVVHYIYMSNQHSIQRNIKTYLLPYPVSTVTKDILHLILTNTYFMLLEICHIANPFEDTSLNKRKILRSHNLGTHATLWE